MTKALSVLVLAVAVLLACGVASAQTHTGNVTITGQAIVLQSNGNGNVVPGNFIVGGTNPKQFYWDGINRWQFNSPLKVTGDLEANLVRTGVSANTGVTDIYMVFGNQATGKFIRWRAPNNRFETSSSLQIEGTGTVNILEITGGSDFAEDFNVNDSSDVEPGTVVVIDAENAGQLKVSQTAYDRTVAGIVSGAGGLSVGMRMGQKGTVADGDHPVALSGRVYCKVDATLAAVAPGDLLTTSNTPGHAMKVLDHAQATGAIIGKAMTPLAQGETGLVLVLVSLQ